jgi:uncharacterized membrane protein YgaE (UPF0421/DUF939 family)
MIIVTIAPLSSGHIITQGQNVFWGCLGGFVFAFPVWLILRADYTLLFIVGLVLAYLYAFFSRKSVMYSIAMTQICLIVIFEYTSPNLSGFFVLDRGLAAIFGITLVYVVEYIFLKLYSKKIDQAVIQKAKDITTQSSKIIENAIKTYSQVKLEALQRQLFNEYMLLSHTIIEMESRFGINDAVLNEVKNQSKPIQEAILILQISNPDDKSKLIAINEKLATQ